MMMRTFSKICWAMLWIWMVGCGTASDDNSQHGTDDGADTGEDSNSETAEDSATSVAADTAGTADTQSSDTDKGTADDSDTRYGADSEIADKILDTVQAELDGLSFSVTGSPGITAEAIPEDVNQGANWGLQTIICADGGYDLESFAGQDVYRIKVDIEGECGGIPIAASVLATEDGVVCLYLYDQDQNAVPGIFAVNDTACSF